MNNILLRVLIVLFSVSVSALVAQPSNETFEKAVSDWNLLKSLRTASAESTQLQNIKEQAEPLFESAMSALDQLQHQPPDSLALLIQFVRWSAANDYCHLLDQIEEKELAFQTRITLLGAARQLMQSEFPIEYKGASKYFILQRFDFEQDVNLFLAELGYAYFERQNMEVALPILKEADLMAKLEAKNAVRNSYALFTLLQTVQNPIDSSLLRVALQLFQDWNALDQASRLELDKSEVLPDACTKVIERSLIAHPGWSEDGAVWANSARLLAAVHKEEQSVAFASNAMLAGYKEREFLLSLFPMALRVGDKATARLAVDKLAAQLTQGQCDFYQLVASNYQAIGEEALASKYQRNAEACQQVDAKANQRREREGGLYLGAYVFPWFRTDWGAVAGIQTRKWYLEFSYQELSDRRDKLYDIRFRGVDGAADQKVRWDGYYSHVSINRTSGKKGARTYSGLLLGYNKRNYQRMLVQTILDDTGTVVNSWGPEEFRPTEERYILMLNSGAHFNGRFLASNTYFSFGGAWNRFDKGFGSAFVERSPYEYLGNPLLNGRKANRFSLMARIGITIGFQVGPRTFQPRKKETNTRY